MVLENNSYPRDSRVRKEAESLAGAGYSVEVIAPRGRGQRSREVIGGVVVRRLRIPDGRGTVAGTALEYLIAGPVLGVAILARVLSSATGTLHVHNPPDFFFPLLWIAKRRGWSTVFDHHDDAAGMFREKVPRRTGIDGLFAWMRQRSAAAAELTVCTNATQKELLRRDAGKIAVVRNGPPVWFSECRPSPPNGSATLVFLGEIGTQDRVQLAVEILHELRVRTPLDVRLLVVGDGPQRGHVEARARSLGVSSQVTVTGWVPYETVPTLLASAHVGLDTARPTEVNHGSTMIKILEYLCVGLPVVATPLRETEATSAGAVITVATDDVSAFVEPIRRLLTDSDTWTGAADRSRARGNELGWSAQEAELVAAYGLLNNNNLSHIHGQRKKAGGRVNGI